MASKREKGKIDHSAWPAIVARHSGGETLASIARSYGCTPPAIGYIVRRLGRPSKPGARGGGVALEIKTPRDAAAASSPISSERHGDALAAAGSHNGAPERSAPSTRPGIDRQLREQVNSDIAAFLVAFDTAFLNDTPGNRDALLDATDRLLRAGARTRIALEWIEVGSSAPKAHFGDDRRNGRQRAAGSARRSG